MAPGGTEPAANYSTNINTASATVPTKKDENALPLPKDFQISEETASSTEKTNKISYFQLVSFIFINSITSIKNINTNLTPNLMCF